MGWDNLRIFATRLPRETLHAHVDYAARDRRVPSNKPPALCTRPFVPPNTRSEPPRPHHVPASHMMLRTDRRPINLG